MFILYMHICIFEYTYWEKKITTQHSHTASLKCLLHSYLFAGFAAKTCSPTVTLHSCSTHLSPQNNYNK